MSKNSDKRRELHIGVSSILAGCMLGFCLGILSSICSSVALKALGRPNFLIRPSWEEIHVVLMIIGGTFSGALYGVILLAIQDTARCRISIILLFAVTLLEGAVLYATLDYISISTRNLMIHNLGHLIVFSVAVANALMLAKKPREIVYPEEKPSVYDRTVLPNNGLKETR